MIAHASLMVVAMMKGKDTKEDQLCHLLLILVDITMNHATPATVSVLVATTITEATCKDHHLINRGLRAVAAVPTVGHGRILSMRRAVLAVAVAVWTALSIHMLLAMRRRAVDVIVVAVMTAFHLINRGLRAVAAVPAVGHGRILRRATPAATTITEATGRDHHLINRGLRAVAAIPTVGHGRILSMRRTVLAVAVAVWTALSIHMLQKNMAP